MRIFIPIGCLLFLSTGCYESAPFEPGSDSETGTGDSDTDTNIDTGVPVDTDTETTDDDSDTLSALCVNLPSLPIEPKILEGFTGSEDFAFDDLGNTVSIDPEGNLVRVSKDGVTRPWVPDLMPGLGAAGIVFLPTGELIVSDGADTLYKVYANGGSEALLSGLAYPNGVTTNPEGMVYVAENNAGRIREVDPVTGEYTIIATGLNNPNGLAFSPDFNTLYCGSFGAGIVYRISRDVTGGWSKVEELGRTPDAPGDPAKDACLGKAPDEPCDGYMDGLCRETRNGLICTMISVCDKKEVDDPCEESGMAGACRDDGAGGLFCDPFGACDALKAGDPCTEFGMTGECRVDDLGELFCAPINPCEGAKVGDPCEDYGAPGRCAEMFEGELYCQMPAPCEGLAAGDICEEYGVSGVCETDLDGYLYCVFPSACSDKAAGDPCQEWDWTGVCVDDGWGELYCGTPDPCEGLEEGALCSVDGFAGICTDMDGGLYCDFGNGGGNSGGLDGIGVDACGNVYVTEYVLGNVWRFSPDGATVELVFTTDDTDWIPNMHWGAGYGGFERDRLYVAERGNNYMFEVNLGVSGAPIAWPGIPGGDE